MIIRASVKEDLPEIIQLLKESMGETLVPKSEAYFSWKHFENPFGASKIIVAVEDDQIIGLRAFMRWNWVYGGQDVPAVRAVDTATHPNHQGKGIFKQLTLAAVEVCKKEGTALVFNSPNPISMQGYLKMGWVKAGIMPIMLRFGFIFPSFYNEKRLKDCYEVFSVERALAELGNEWTLPNVPQHIHTPISHSYLKWRYLDCPILKYGAIIQKGEFGLVFRLKRFSRFNELRICECWLENNETGYRLAQQALRKIVYSTRPILVSCAPSPLFNRFGKEIIQWKLPINKGPQTTVRPLQMEDLGDFINFKNWQPSIGSMELF